MVEYVKRLYEYDRWATDRIAQAMATPDEIDVNALGLLGHMHWAQQLWLFRAGGPYDTPDDIWALKSYEACIADGPGLTRAWIKLIEQTPLDEPVTYVTMKGKGDRFTDTLCDIAMHVINHGTHHRAQISAILRGQGVTPPTTDYIFYLHS